jgi:NADPH:quinone reductase-like Zn-dependent oxidoreductase
VPASAHCGGRNTGGIRFHGGVGNAFPSRHVRLYFLGGRLRGRRGRFYGITMQYRKDPGALRKDLPRIFTLMAEKKIDPLVRNRFLISDAREALELLATGAEEGKIVLTRS